MSVQPQPAPDESSGTPSSAGDEATRIAALVADSVGVGLWLVDGEDRTVYRNRSLQSCAGDLAGLEELAAGLPGVPVYHFVDRVRAGQGPVEEPALLLKRAGRPGRLMELRIESGPLAGSLLIAMRDVTDRARVQRLGALVETAMALGHEISNPLAILRGEIELLGQETDSSTARLERMLRSVDRIEDVLQRLRTLAEPQSTAYLPSRGARMVNLDQTDAAEDAR